MSWSFNYIGKPAAIAAKARAQIAENGGAAGEPETSVRAKTLEHIAVMAEALVGTFVIKVNAAGSMSRSADGISYHSVQMEFMPMYGSVE